MAKQIIYCGWDSPPAAPIARVGSWNQQQPACRGVDSFVAQAVRGPNHKQLLNLASPESWNASDFTDYLPSGNGLLWARLLGGNKPIPSWDRVCEHVSHISSVAADSDYDGLLLDIESYKNTVPIFQSPLGMEFSQAKDLAYLQGRQFSMSMKGRTLAFHRLLSHLIDLVPPVGGGDRQIPLARHLYGLLPAFISGLLSDGARLVDFCGTNLPREPDEVYEQFVAVRSILPEICECDYRKVRLGQSMYLDQFVGSKKLDFYGMLQAHYRCSEVGVLLYGETGRLCLPNSSIRPFPPVPYQLWIDIVPGFSDSLCRVDDPVGFAREYTASHPSILGNWFFGQRPGSDIRLAGADTLTGIGGGWLFQQVEVKPGQSFAFSCQTTGRDNVWMGGRWRDRLGWVEDRRSSRKFYPDELGWCSGTMIAPPGTETLLVTMAVEHSSTSDRTIFMKSKVCRI